MQDQVSLFVEEMIKRISIKTRWGFSEVIDLLRLTKRDMDEGRPVEPISPVAQANIQAAQEAPAPVTDAEAMAFVEQMNAQRGLKEEVKESEWQVEDKAGPQDVTPEQIEENRLHLEELKREAERGRTKQ